MLSCLHALSREPKSLETLRIPDGRIAKKVFPSNKRRTCKACLLPSTLSMPNRQPCILSENMPCLTRIPTIIANIPDVSPKIASVSILYRYRLVIFPQVTGVFRPQHSFCSYPVHLISNFFQPFLIYGNDPKRTRKMKRQFRLAFPPSLHATDRTMALSGLFLIKPLFAVAERV